MVVHQVHYVSFNVNCVHCYIAVAVLDAFINVKSYLVFFVSLGLC